MLGSVVILCFGAFANRFITFLQHRSDESIAHYNLLCSKQHETIHQKYYPVLSDNVLLIGRIRLDLLFKFSNFRYRLTLSPFRESYFNNTFTTNTTVEPFQRTTNRGSGLRK